MEEKYKKFIKKGVMGLIILILAIIFWPLTTIKAGERGIVLRFGAVNRILESGLHLVLPIGEQIKMINVQTQKEQIDSGAASKDLQTVTAVVALNYHLIPEQVGNLWKTLGGDYKIRIIDPAIQESVKSATAKFTAEELITKRTEVKDLIKLSLTERLLKEFIIVDELSIVNFNFSKSFNEAIESKVTAEQNALTQKNKLEQIKYEAEQIIVTAKGNAEARISNATAEAEAIKIQAQAITQQGGRDYVSLKAIEKWNGQLPVQMIPNSTVPFINLDK